MKSILIFDTPTRCYDCPLYTSIDDADEYGFCDDRNILKQKEAQKKIRFDKKPDWCPLIPLPKKFNEGIEYDMDGFGFDKYLETGFKMGWDAYYDKITKNHIGENTEKVCNDDLYENWMFFDKGETE